MASIRKRPRATGGNAWIVDYRDASGRRRWITCESREEAEQVRAMKVRESSQAEPPVSDPKITVQAYSERWLDQIAHDLKARTVHSYAQLLRLHILPAFGRLRLMRLHRG